uniref:Uncharacterized protein n=1 Tax=Utricularia reniformis TaxID=192314 RepID=A0A1Y0B2C3_9LAMI|nr:hypothetical protein AEK19_MT1343 [Utricularia reniformis]ART31541.1 hypothetical protein AEK19_MT1343 [Utricularia reniformis]
MNIIFIRQTRRLHCLFPMNIISSRRDNRRLPDLGRSGPREQNLKRGLKEKEKGSRVGTR